ncbi:unnamed protein product [Linum trigynum]|uniref:GRF-type domain-containing protein n=1 Tax=Linum trigynum TaxID=586398 RepID=A0AAV2EQI6_9ROSI
MSHRGGSSSRSENSIGVVCCYHNVPAVTNRAGTESNSGRRFYGCKFWMVPKKNCNFFRWVDGAVDEGDASNSGIDSTILNLQENLRLAEAKAERRKKERKIVVQELRKVNNDVRVIRHMFAVVILLNVVLLAVVLANRSSMI